MHVVPVAISPARLFISVCAGTLLCCTYNTLAVTAYESFDSQQSLWIPDQSRHAARPHPGIHAHEYLKLTAGCIIRATQRCQRCSGRRIRHLCHSKVRRAIRNEKHLDWVTTSTSRATVHRRRGRRRGGAVTCKAPRTHSASCCVNDAGRLLR